MLVVRSIALTLKRKRFSRVRPTLPFSPGTWLVRVARVEFRGARCPDPREKKSLDCFLPDPNRALHIPNPIGTRHPLPLCALFAPNNTHLTHSGGRYQALVAGVTMAGVGVGGFYAHQSGSAYLEELGQKRLRERREREARGLVGEGAGEGQRGASSAATRTGGWGSRR